MKCFLVEMSAPIFVGGVGLFHSLVVVAHSESQLSVMTLVSLAESAYVGQWVPHGVGLGGKAERGQRERARVTGGLIERLGPQDVEVELEGQE